MSNRVFYTIRDSYKKVVFIKNKQLYNNYIVENRTKQLHNKINIRKNHTFNNPHSPNPNNENKPNISLLFVWCGLCFYVGYKD